LKDELTTLMFSCQKPGVKSFTCSLLVGTTNLSIAETVIEYGGQTEDGGFDHEAMMQNIIAQVEVEASPTDEEGSSGFYVSRDDGSSHYSNGNGYNRATDADGDVTESYYGNTINR